MIVVMMKTDRSESTRIMVMGLVVVVVLHPLSFIEEAAALDADAVTTHWLYCDTGMFVIVNSSRFYCIRSSPS